MTEAYVDEGGNNSWMSIADVMSALMMVFMFIAVAFMYQLQKEKNLSNTLDVAYQLELNKALHKEFDNDLSAWEAEITDENVFRFSSPFGLGSSHIPLDFKSILSEFFPRYVALLTKDKFKNEIEELRVEGHTSYGWGENDMDDDNYLNNMYLSQRRASNVLDYSYRLHAYFVQKNKQWLTKHLRANGMSFSNLIYQSDEKIIQDKEKSRRVEFRVMVKNNNYTSLN